MSAKFPPGTLILNTRSRIQAEEFTSSLKRAGADVLEIPVLEIRSLPLEAEVLSEIAALQSGDVLAFTSSNAIRALSVSMTEELHAVLQRVQIATIGRGTEKMLNLLECAPSIISDLPSAEALGETVGRHLEGTDAKIVLLKGDTAGKGFSQALPEHKVSEHTVYSSRASETLEQDLQAAQAELEKLSAVVFMSPLVVEVFFAASKKVGALHKKLSLLPAVVVGPKTAIQAGYFGYESVFPADESSISGIVQKLLQILC